MAKPKLYAVTWRYKTPNPDGSVGVVVLNRRSGWSPSAEEKKYIDGICDQVCDWINDDMMAPGQTALVWEGDGPLAPAQSRGALKIIRSARSLSKWAKGKFAAGLFIEHCTHAEHGTVQ